MISVYLHAIKNEALLGNSVVSSTFLILFPAQLREDNVSLNPVYAKIYRPLLMSLKKDETSATKYFNANGGESSINFGVKRICLNLICICKIRILD